MCRLYLGFIGSILLFSASVYADHAPNTYNFFENLEENSSPIDHQEKIYFEEDDTNKHAYMGEDQPEASVSIISNDFYQNDRLRFYNQTRYDISDLKNKYLQDGLAQLSLSDISFSLGYGMEYKFTTTHSIGYEYISSFPSNNTQSIRVFWKRIF